MPHPKKIETVHVETLDGELCIYDWQRMEVHNLNPTAATVWNLCDGQTSPQQMAVQLKDDLTAAQAEELVWLTLARLEKAHLLQDKVVKPAGPQREVITRRELLRGLGMAAALLPVITSIVAPGPIEAQSPQPPVPPPTGSQTFNFTGAEQQFTVPAGVTSVTIEAFGAEGGASLGGLPGGLGGRSVATIAVTAGETLFVYVGGRGGDADTSANPDIPGAGGFNGGGGGGAGFIFAGGGGGGASDVRQGGNGLANRVVVAGGGGGAGASAGFGLGGFGGNGGGTTGANGETPFVTPPVTSGTGGGGGTQSSGGTGGSGGGGNPAGTNGSSGAGGVGGSGGVPVTSGGGGGGGGSSGSAPNNDGGGGGGGGGSSFAIPTTTGVTHQQGVRFGNGQVIISW